MNFEEKKLDSKTVFSGKILSVDVDKVELPDGRESFRECIRHQGGAAVLFIEDGKVLLVKQYRYVYGKEIYEIPAGKLEVGEPPEKAAVRELKEETGIVAEELVRMFCLYPSPGYTDEVIHVFRVGKYRKAEQKLDEGEFLDVEFKEIGEVLEMIEDGRINDAKTVAAVYGYLGGR